MSTRVSLRRLEATLDTLGDLACEDHEELDGQTRDDLAHLRYAIECIVERRRAQ